MHWNQFCFQFWENLSQTQFSFTQLNRTDTQNLEKSNFDMSYKNECWLSHPLANMRNLMCNMKEE